MKKIKPITVHTARTIMFMELEKVMNFSIQNDNYIESMNNNVFGKKSQDGIKKTSGFLLQLYKFDLSSNKFKAFKYFWSNADESEKAVLAIVFASTNDYLLKESISAISQKKIGEKVDIESIEENIEKYQKTSPARSYFETVYYWWCFEGANVGLDRYFFSSRRTFSGSWVRIS